MLLWLPLAFMVAAIVAGLALAAVRALRAWRDVKRLGKRVREELDGVSRAAAEIEVHLERASAGSERLTAALDRLARSRARLDVQRAALKEARASVLRAVPILPYFVRR